MSFKPSTSNAFVLLSTILFRRALRSPIPGFLDLSTLCGFFFFLTKVVLAPLAFLSTIGDFAFFWGVMALRDALVVNAAVDAR